MNIFLKSLTTILLVVLMDAFTCSNCAAQLKKRKFSGCGFDRTEIRKLGYKKGKPKILKSHMTADQGQKLVVKVIFHVIYSNATQNISAANIQKEIDDLNRDYQMRNADIDQVYPLYKNLVSNPNISFVFADTTFDGSPDKGIRRVIRSSSGDLYRSDPVISPDRYLNVYSGKISSDGFTYTNPWENPRTDAIFLYYEWIGGSYRLLSHETGHWLGLYHTFQDGCSLPNDGIADTPPQNGPTGIGAGCDPKSMSHQCAGYSFPMFNNYMDYSDCRVMFTKGQVAAMRQNIIAYRPVVFQQPAASATKL